MLENNNNDSIYLEPLIFGYLTNNSLRNKSAFVLEPLLFNKIKTLVSKPIVFKSDNDGIAYFPGIGYFIVPFKNKSINILYRNDNYFLYRNKNSSENISYCLKNETFIPRTSIELGKYSHRLYSRFFVEWDNKTKNFSKKSTEVEINNIAEKFQNLLFEAFYLVEKFCPEQFEQYNNSTKRIILFNNPKIRNFAVRNLYGTAFICAKPNDSIVYFLEEIVHQCSHNAFNAITANLTAFFKINPETPLKQFSKQNWDYRSIYNALHGLYTIAARLDCFDKCLDNIDGMAKLELIGRFADLRKRYRNGLETLDLEKVFTDSGSQLYKLLDEFCEKTFHKRAHLINKFDFSNQPSEFDAQRFFELNSIQKIEETYFQLENIEPNY